MRSQKVLYLLNKNHDKPIENLLFSAKLILKARKIITGSYSQKETSNLQKIINDVDVSRIHPTCKDEYEVITWWYQQCEISSKLFKALRATEHGSNDALRSISNMMEALGNKNNDSNMLFTWENYKAYQICKIMLPIRIAHLNKNSTEVMNVNYDDTAVEGSLWDAIEDVSCWAYITR